MLRYAGLAATCRIDVPYGVPAQAAIGAMRRRAATGWRARTLQGLTPQTESNPPTTEDGITTRSRSMASNMWCGSTARKQPVSCAARAIRFAATRRVSIRTPAISVYRRILVPSLSRMCASRPERTKLGAAWFVVYAINIRSIRICQYKDTVHPEVYSTRGTCRFLKSASPSD